MHESEQWKWSHSAVSDSSQPHGLQPTRLLRPWDFLGKRSGVPSPSLCYTLIVYILKLFYHFLPKCLHESVIQKFRSSIKKSSNLSISYKKVLMIWSPCVTVPSNYLPCNPPSSHVLSALGWEYTSPLLCFPLGMPCYSRQGAVLPVVIENGDG